MAHVARAFVAGFVGIVLVVGWTAYRVQEQGGRDERRSAGAIVVMGAAQYDGRPSPVLEERIRHGVELYRDGIAPYLIVTGGKATDDTTTEASAARAWAEEHGVPASAILAEDQGRTTLESVESVALILRARGLTSAVFVSDRTHMLRVLRMATDQGVVAWGSPTTSGPVDADPGRRFEAVVHEIGALAVYFVGGGRILPGALGANP